MEAKVRIMGNWIRGEDRIHPVMILLFHASKVKALQMNTQCLFHEVAQHHMGSHCLGSNGREAYGRAKIQLLRGR